MRHLLEAAAKCGTTEGHALRQSMAEFAVNDMMTTNGAIRPDEYVLRDMHLFQVKTPAESHYKHDFCKLVATIPGKDAFRPMAGDGCKRVKA